MRTAETRTLLLLFRHENKASTGTSLVPRCREGGGEKGAPGVYCMREQWTPGTLFSPPHGAGNQASTGTCMSVHYKWFNPLSDCTLRRLEWKSTLSFTEYLYFYIEWGKHYALNLSHPLPMLQQHPHSVEHLPLTSHSSS